MSPTAVLRRLVHVLLDPPDFPDTVAAFRFLAAADERRARGGCTCMTVDHALSLTDWMSIAVALQAACEQGRTELAGYLAQRMEPCATRGVTLMDALFEMDVPAATERLSDFKSWVAEVRWAFEAAALSSEVFTTYSVAKANELPEPPDTAHHWGLLTMLLHAEGLIRPVGWASAKRGPSHASSLKTWVGVTTRIGSAA